MSTPPYDSTQLKEMLCKYFNCASDRSRLTICEKHYLGLGGDHIHYYDLLLRNGKDVRHAFGKIAPNNDREYRALEYLIKSVPKQELFICWPIGLIKNGSSSLLVLEFLGGYANPFTLQHSLSLWPKTVSRITQIGRDILDKMYQLQTHCPTTYSPINEHDTRETPGQPRPISVLKQLEQIESISSEKRMALVARVKRIVASNVQVRRGVVHGQMGMRNVMINGSNICFIDWEFMESDGFCLFDPCYMVTMLLMRSVQLLISRGKLEQIGNDLFGHIKELEDRHGDAVRRKSTDDALWFAKCLAMVDSLWAYEKSEYGRKTAWISQRARRIKCLSAYIEKDIAE